MTMSCNGCRVLRKGCSDDCSIRPCLQWIKSPESQGHATLFLAKFYGRAGLLNLVNAGPDHLRPAIFRSLLYEACGRIVNPTYGSVGLLWSGRWQLCQAAVDAVLKGAPIMQISFENPAADSPLPPLHKAASYDIRHIAKGAANPLSLDLHTVNNASRTPFKRVGCHANGIPASLTKPRRTSLGSTHDGDLAVGPNDARVRDSFRWCFPIRFQREPSHDSSATQGPNPSSAGAAGADPGEGNPGDGGENESVFSVETVEMPMMTTHGMEPRKTGRSDRVSLETDVGLELTLGFESPHAHHSHSPHGSGSSHGRRHNPSRSDPRPGHCFRLPIGGSGLAAERIQAST